MSLLSKHPQSFGIIVVATNAYFLLGLRLMKSFSHHYKGKFEFSFYLFSDKYPHNYISISENVYHFYKIHGDFVESTQSKFDSIIEIKDILETRHSHIYYIDADTDICSDFIENFFLGENVALKHFMNDNEMKEVKNYDRNPLSSAYIPYDTPLPQMYYHACFWGGQVHEIVSMCETLLEAQRKDELIDYVPVWHDESYLNHYYHYSPPTITIDPSIEFEFKLSDKAGLAIERNPNFEISQYLAVIARNKASAFRIDGEGNISFSSQMVQSNQDSGELESCVVGQLLRQTTHLVLEETGSENLLIYPDSDQAISLNEIALLIWKLCDGTRTANDIINLLLENFPADADKIVMDVPATLDKLVCDGAIAQLIRPT